MSDSYITDSNFKLKYPNVISPSVKIKNMYMGIYSNKLIFSKYNL